MEKIKSLVFLLVLSSLVACNSDAFSSAYPSDRGVYPSNVGISTQPIFDASHGAIVGKLINSHTGQPVPGVVLYLAKLLPLTPGPDHLITFDLTTAPQTVVKTDGTFIFEFIAPDEYEILSLIPHEIPLVRNPDNPSEELIFLVEAGQVVNLGTVAVSVP